MYEENAKGDDSISVKKKLGELASGDVNANDGQGVIADVYDNCTVLFADIAGKFCKVSWHANVTQREANSCTHQHAPHNALPWDSLLLGFTKWSDNRAPTQVFQLLEAIYGTFDRNARKRGVFKIETIGDSYLAVTGTLKVG